MKNVKRKILTSSIFLGCAFFALGAASVISRNVSPDAVTASVSSLERETPVIILDAGHGEST